MFDLLAAIQEIEPTAIPLVAIMLSSVAMYLVGIILPCSPCCNSNPCELCTEGQLPDTVTVSLSGYIDSEVQGPYLTSLSFDATFGSGAEGRLSAPSGHADAGPVESVEITGGGGGYARIARVAPTITAHFDGGGSGGSLGVTLTETAYDGRSAWLVASLDIDDGGSGYPAEGAITFDISDDDTEVLSAIASYTCSRAEPTVSLAVSGTGTSASLSPLLTYYAPEKIWYVSGATVLNGGSGYTIGDSVLLTVVDGDNAGVPFAMTVTVDGGGAVTGVVVDSPYPYYPPWNRGSYYLNTGVIDAVTLLDGGVYYSEDLDGPGEVADVVVSVTQLGPTAGIADGAELSAVIDDDVSSPTFGQITGATINAGGDGYLAWAYRVESCCEDYYNGLSVVLKRQESNRCLYAHGICGTYCESVISMEYFGPSIPPVVGVGYRGGPFVGLQNSCDVTLTSTTTVEDCGVISFTAQNDNGVTATVAGGGEYDIENEADNGTGRCMTCCRAQGSDPPDEIEVEVVEKMHGADPNVWTNPSGIEGDEPPVFVLTQGAPLNMFSFPGYSDRDCGVHWAGGLPNGYRVAVWIQQCADPLAEDCDHCWKKCQTRAAVQTIYNCSGTTNPDRGSSPACISCEDGPTCAPASGDYLITEGVLSSPGFCLLQVVKVTVL